MHPRLTHTLLYMVTLRITQPCTHENCKLISRSMHAHSHTTIHAYPRITLQYIHKKCKLISRSMYAHLHTATHAHAGHSRDTTIHTSKAASSRATLGTSRPAVVPFTLFFSIRNQHGETYFEFESLSGLGWQYYACLLLNFSMSVCVSLKCMCVFLRIEIDVLRM
jgi:hypothetical protein